ncbi:hypothetical protein DH2020_036412 [Rehmannia glutinosa]|uniref:Uncharacterized protein n=1 Tax=Rehmannia glutinosa TaxID=99300 RepID=A0ABR0V687_REHGL
MRVGDLIVGFALKPLILAKLSCQFGARSISIIVQTWVEVLRFALCLHLIILWRLAIWAIAVLSLPVRAFTALYRERLDLKNELENVLWDRKELEEKLHVAIKERKMMEMMLMELEEEHDEAIVQDLKDEMQRLKEIQGKALWSYTNRGDVIDDCNFRQVSKDISKDEMNDPVKNGSKIYGLSQPYVTYTISDEGYNHRDVALSRTLFSAILSLAVGLVVWEADDPCMPLVVALFTVVTMSLWRSPIVYENRA